MNNLEEPEDSGQEATHGEATADYNDGTDITTDAGEDHMDHETEQDQTDRSGRTCHSIQDRLDASNEITGGWKGREGM